MQTAFLVVVAAIGLADLLLSRGVTIAPVALLFVFLKIQAEYAAGRYLKNGLQIKETEPQPEVLEVAPLPSKAKKPADSSPSLQVKNQLKQSQHTDPFFQAPNFRGRPHEVLGIRENAATSLIVKAFRHWIKIYHPDHGQKTEAATEKTRQLTSAKEALLEERKRKRTAPAT